jgi:hypothetical protein
VRPADVGPDDVLIRYLGAAGLYLEWRGEALMVGPFFSNPGLVDVGLGRLRVRRGDVVRGLRGLSMGRVGAILVGHSHYDHLGDVPFVAERFARRARIYVNSSGEVALSVFSGLRERVESVEGRDGALRDGIGLRDAAGRPLPFRVRPVPSHHAPHARFVHLMRGETRANERPWERRRYRSFKEGRPHAYVIDLLDGTGPEARSLFRIHYQDSASSADRSPNGIPPSDLPGPGFDLAVVCMASAHLVKPYPADLLAAVKPRHVLVTHYEDFFRPRSAPCRFVPLLTEGRANRFLESTDRALSQGGRELARPIHPVCGATGEGWTMPLVSEWMVFRRSSDEGESTDPEPR